MNYNIFLLVSAFCGGAFVGSIITFILFIFELRKNLNRNNEIDNLNWDCICHIINSLEKYIVDSMLYIKGNRSEEIIKFNGGDQNANK